MNFRCHLLMPRVTLHSRERCSGACRHLLALPLSLFLSAATPSPRASAELSCGAHCLGTRNPGPSPQSPSLTPASPGDSEVVDLSAQAGSPLWGYGEGCSLARDLRRERRGKEGCTGSQPSPGIPQVIDGHVALRPPPRERQ